MTEAELRSFLERDAQSYRANWLVEAGAGAGKTHLIVQRMVNQLAGGFCAPEELAAITFTNKATNQLRERLTDALCERRNAAATPEEAARLTEIIARVDAVQISTVHSFCQRMLSEMPLAAGLGFSPVMLDESATARYVREFFEAYCREHEDRFASLRALGIEPSGLQEAFLRLLACGDAQAVRLVPGSPEYSRLEKALIAGAEQMRAGIAALLPDGAAAPCTPWLTRALTFEPVTSAEKAAGWVFLAEAFTTARNRRGCSVSVTQWEDGSPKKLDLQRLIPDPDSPAVAAWNEFSENSRTASKWKAEIDKLETRSNPTAKSIATLAERRRELAQLEPVLRKQEQSPECRFVHGCIRLILQTKDISGLVKQRDELLHALISEALERCRDAMVRDKQARGFVSFDDLLTRARDLVRDDPDARRTFGSRWRVIYVDEFQDTDPVQAQLLFYLTAEHFDRDWTKCVPRPGSLFLVGDPKQSIYRFRRADIEVYDQVRRLFAQGQAGQVATMQYNFRSTEALCEYVTGIFCPVMTGTDYQAGFIEMHSPSGRTAPGSGAYSFPAEGPEGCPAAVAAFIERAVETKRAAFRDFMILCRTKSQVEVYRDALRARHIPVNASGQHDLSDTLPVARCALWCDFLLHPRNPVAAVQLLDSAGVSPAQIFAVQQHTGCDLMTLLRTDASEIANLPDGLSSPARMLARMRRAQRLCAELPPSALVEELLSGDFGLWDGADRRQDFSWVCQYLAMLRRAPDQSLHGLLGRAVQLAHSSLERQLDSEPDADQVQVMNLHKSKGLEARVVFLAPGKVTSRGPVRHMRRGKALLRFSGRRAGEDEQRFTAVPPGWDDASGEEEKFAAAENDRLVYVAATRAAELLLVGRCPSVGGDAWGLLDCPELKPGALPGWDTSPLFDPQGTPCNLTERGADAPDASQDAKLKHALASLPGASRISVTPSGLDHPEPPARLAQDDTADAPAQQPHGNLWGTIVHRTLELAVNRSAWDEARLLPLAAQAANETLPPQLSAAERRMLGLEERDGAPAQHLAAHAATLCRDILRDGSALRTLLAGGDAVTEYPFWLSADDAADPLYEHIFRSLPGCRPDGRPVDLHGVIDLAVRTEQGWVVVDYKTDLMLPGESEAQYAQRLKTAYAPQVATYALVLSRLTPGVPVRLYLCAVALGGALIELAE